MRLRTPSLAAAALCLSLSVSMTGCSDSDDEPTAEDTATASSTPTPTPTPSDTPTEEPPPPSQDSGTGVAITIAGDEITPAGDRVEVQRDEVVTLEITSDRAGELHVHSKPEQYVEFEAGTSTHELTVSAPGVVDVEDHETGTVIVQLEVS